MAQTPKKLGIVLISTGANPKLKKTLKSILVQSENVTQIIVISSKAKSHEAVIKFEELKLQFTGAKFRFFQSMGLSRKELIRKGSSYLKCKTKIVLNEGQIFSFHRNVL